MSSPEYIRKLIDELTKKRGAEDKQAAEARSKQLKKEGEAASASTRASRATSESMARMYERQAESAAKEAHRQGSKAVDHGKRSAEYTAKEAQLSQQYSAAVAKQRVEEERQRKRRERDEEQAQRRREEEARRARERERRAERARTESLLTAAEDRLGRQIVEVRPPQVERLRILYVTASAEGDLRVDKEIRRVEKGVQAATHRDLVEIKPLLAATASDLLDALSGFRPHVVHFAGHANEQVLVFDTDADHDNAGHEVGAGLFARAVGAVDEPPVLVVLNACHSAGQLESLLDVVPLAIGMSDEIGDADAMSFAARFYTAIADGQSVGSAYAAARVQMEFDGMPDADLPVLAKRPDVDPGAAQLAIPTRDLTGSLPSLGPEAARRDRQARGTQDPAGACTASSLVLVG